MADLGSHPVLQASRIGGQTYGVHVPLAELSGYLRDPKYFFPREDTNCPRRKLILCRRGAIPNDTVMLLKLAAKSEQEQR